MNSTYKCILDTGFITRCALIPLRFEYYNKIIRLDFIFSETADRSTKHVPTFSGNPDFIIMSFIRQTDSDMNIGYGEDKSFTTASNHLLISELYIFIFCLPLPHKIVSPFNDKAPGFSLYRKY